jgi:TetR/AcrR family transcriptional repressor of nem operon
MRAGRPKTFDEREVLDKAMHLFWLRGYAGVGLRELQEHMGISRQSLYDTFGSKRELFIRAIEHYRETQLTTALALLAREGSPLQNVKDVLAFFEQLASDASCRGCLVANALVEMGPHDPEIAALLQDTLERLQGSIREALDEAQRRGEVPGDRSAQQISRALTNAAMGMAVTGRLRGGRATLQDIYAGTLALLG